MSDEARARSVLLILALSCAFLAGWILSEFGPRHIGLWCCIFLTGLITYSLDLEE